MHEHEARVADSLRALVDALPVRIPTAIPDPAPEPRPRWRRTAVAALAAVAALVVGTVVWRVAGDRGAVSPVDTAVPVQPTQPPVVSDPLASVPGPPMPRWMLADPAIGAGSTILTDSGVTAQQIGTSDLAAQVPVVRSLIAEHRLGPIVVIHVGTEAPLPAGGLGSVLDELASIPTVVLATVHGDTAWAAANNAEVVAAATGRTNVSVFDWAKVAAMCPGRCVADDGLTLTDDGVWFYVEQLAGYVGFSIPQRPAAPATLPILAVTADGDAVMIPAGQDTPIVLYDLPDGSPNRVTAIAVTDDDRAFVGTCCQPLSGEAFEVHPSTLDQPATHAAFAPVVDDADDDRGLVYAVPEGLRAGSSLAGDGMQIMIPSDVGALIDVAWLDGFPEPIPAPFNYGQGQIAALSRAADGIHLVTAADVARTNPLDHHAVVEPDAAAELRLAGTRDGLVLVFDPAQPSVVTAYDPTTLTAMRTIDLPGPARSVWIQEDAMVWVDAGGALHDGDRTLPGAYAWARR